jgi:RNA polymerase sigma factor (sigma-70 family)
MYQNDASGFRALVARHGPMVIRVCRSILRDPHDAEDAFQLTFMVLIQKGVTINSPEALGRWLCGVAYKTAVRVRRRGSRRRTHERPWIQEPADDRCGEIVDQDLLSLVREELGRLPEKYRSPLVLCYFEGLTHEEAAEHLGWASGTVKVRLVRGRKLLRERLDRRKVALGAGLLTLWKQETKSAIGDALVDSTVASARPMSASKAVLGQGLNSGLHRVSSPFARADLLFSVAVTLLLTLGVVGGISWGFAMVKVGPGHSIITDDLPANLMDVLAVDCR